MALAEHLKTTVPTCRAQPGLLWPSEAYMLHDSAASMQKQKATFPASPLPRTPQSYKYSIATEIQGKPLGAHLSRGGGWSVHMQDLAMQPLLTGRILQLGPVFACSHLAA